jgi:hypothetical protein
MNSQQPPWANRAAVAFSAILACRNLADLPEKLMLKFPANVSGRWHGALSHASLLVLLGLMNLLPCRAAAAEQGKPIQVISFNLRFASTNSPNAWVDRRPVVKALLRKTSPDLVGTQEGLYQQIKDIAADLPAYQWIGIGRDGGSRGEFMGVFYREDRFEPLEFDHFWLSDTPSVIGSTTWGHKNHRMVNRLLTTRTVPK